MTTERRDALQLLEHLRDPEEETTRMTERIGQITETSDRLEKALDCAEDAVWKVQKATKLLEEHNDGLSAVVAKKQGYENFRDNVQGWLRKASPGVKEMD
jgi:exoribonuclease R